MRWIISLILILSFSFLEHLNAQKSKNPFELTYRLKYFKKDLNLDTITKSDTTATSIVLNDADPVEGLIQSRESLKNGDSTSQVVPMKIDTGQLSSKNSEFDLPDVREVQVLKRSLLFWIFLFLLLSLTFMISLNRVILTKIYKSLLNDNYLNLIWREQRGNISLQYFILYFLFIINAGLFLYLALVNYQVNLGSKSILTSIFIVALVYFVRHSAMGIISFVFPIKKEISQFNFTILIFNIFLGMCLLPLNAIITFAPEKIAELSLFLGFALIAFMYIYRQLRGLFIGRSFLIFRKFHFFIYLCAIEIAPLLVLLKFTNSLIQN